MQVAYLTGPLHFEMAEEEIPEPKPDQVRIRVAAAGICGTDMEAFLGHTPRGWQIRYPFKMGHEVAGIVDQVGADVTTFQPGDRVVPDGRITCGSCFHCRRGNFSACLKAGYISGGFMEYSVYPEKNLVPIPNSLSTDHGALTEPLSCCLSGRSKLQVSLGDRAVVIGDGPIGIMHAQLLKRSGAQTVLIGISEEKLGVAQKVGIDTVLNGKKRDTVAEIRRLTGGRGADIVVVASGHEKILEQGLLMAARKGQILYFAAALKDRLTLPLDIIHYQELKVIGSYDSTIADYENALQVMAAGQVMVEPLISRRFALKDIQKAFEQAVKREDLKILIQNEQAF